jgi:hypothetical protein
MALSLYCRKTVYQCLDSLISFFTTNNDAKSKGYGSKMSHYDFIETTYLLMDVLPVVSHLCLIFQKTNLDVSLVQSAVSNCRTSLLKIKNEVDAKSYLFKLLHGDLQKNHVVKR